MRHAADYSIPAVILRTPHHGGLGIARSLGRMGVPVYGIDAAQWEPAFASRYCRGRFHLDIGSEPPDLAVAQLQSIARELGGRPVLLPTTDTACIWVAENAGALHQAFRFPAVDVALVRTLCDKNRMQELARKNGVATAHWIAPRSKQDVARFAEEAEFPVMVKEIGSGRLRSRAGGSKFLAHSARELTELYAKAGDPEQPNLILQEFIPGEDWMFNGYFDEHAQCLFGMTGKKIRRFPVNTGVTSLGICLANQTVIRTTTDFMRAIGYRGILDIGYRRDERDGRYKILDVNPRIGCTFRLFAAIGGLDVARALYLDITGQPVPRPEFAEGRKWLVEDFDLFSSFSSWRKGGLSPGDWFRSLAGVQETACFALDDPLPFLMTGVADVCEFYRWFHVQAALRRLPAPAASPAALASQRRP
jgi:predicted ATP-grasp superfamily ATP-dependent carboligase